MPNKILIIGAGSSGASSAIFLAGMGFEVTVVDRKLKNAEGLKIGESLPPNAQQLLMELDVWEAFQSARHLKYYGNKSIWGSSEIAYTDFIQHPLGHGWHIDRCLFETMLLDKAVETGVEILEETTIVDAIYNEVNWEVKLKTKANKSFKKNFDFLIDASGRNAWLARKLNVDRLYESQQLALVAFLKTSKTIEDETSLIETTAEGWWYSTKIPKGRIATSFLCKPEKPERDRWINEIHWWTLLEKASNTARRIVDSGAELLESPRFVSADSGILEEVYGDGWIAVGDAAMAYDPIASHGILMGMVSARDAAKAIKQYFEGSQKSMEAYSALLWASFQNYTRQRRQFYLSEQRFEHAKYWESFL